MTVSADGNGCSMRFGDSGGIDSGSGNYSYKYGRAVDGDGNYAASNSASATYIEFTAGIGNATGEGFSAIMYIGGPGDKTGRPFVHGTYVGLGTASAVAQGSFAGQRTAVITVDRILIQQNSGNISGRLSLYGIAHA